jgi:hypothetical protein
MDDSLPVEEQCRLYVHPDLLVWEFNEFKGNAWTTGALNFTSGFYSDGVVSIVPAGEHSFSLSYYKNKGSYVYTADDISLVYNFLPNRFYYMYPIASISTVGVFVIDATELTADMRFKFEEILFLQIVNPEKVVKARTVTDKRLEAGKWKAVPPPNRLN